MSDILLLIIAVSLFVGGHELLSHPLRAPIVRVAGEKGFMAIYAVVALGSLYWAVEVWKIVPPDRLWQAPPALYMAAPLVMLIAFILFVGSVTAPNPALMGGGAPSAKPEISGVRGVQAITRHPMMWAFALWAIVHITLSADSRTLVLGGGILILSLFGSAMQDRKKLAAQEGYAGHVAKTSFTPFLAQITGRAPLGSLWPGFIPVIGGVILWGVMLWLHPSLIGVAAIQH